MILRPLAAETFIEEETKIYLQRIGFIEPKHIQAIYQTTKGLPYYLNWIREQKEQGKQLDFSHGKLEIVDLLLQGLSLDQITIVQLAACCHWFDRSIIEFLLSQSDPALNFSKAVDQKLDCFEWLKRRDFIRLSQYRYYFDDVARDVFRFSLWQDNQEKFHHAHALLAAYFEDRLKQMRSISSGGDSPSANLLIYTVEFIYHSIFSNLNENQTQIIGKLFLDEFSDKAEILNLVFATIIAEAEVEEHPYLSPKVKEVLLALKLRYQIN